MAIYTLPALLSPEECTAAIRAFPPPRPAAVGTEAAAGTGIAHRAVRRGTVARLLLEEVVRAAPALQRVQDVLQRANDLAFHFELAGIEALQLADYHESDGYDWHLDLGPGGAARRKLSLTVQLSSPEDYDGGDLEIWGAPPAPREQGTVIVFPAYLLHRVRPVHRGRRLSLVAWALGACPFQ